MLKRYNTNFMIVTPSDIEMFIHEKSPHVKNVEVNVNDDGIWLIKIKLQWWYRFFYERTFYDFINEQIEENIINGIDWDVTLTS